MEHRVSATPYPLRPNLACGRMEQAHEFGRAIPQVLVRLAYWLALWFPARAWIGYGLQWTGLVEPPHRDAHLLAFSVSAFDQIFLASASGSVTSTTSPLLRLRLTLPVSHQLRVLCQSKPVSRKTFQMV